jgi:hypothetical protein
VRPLATGKSPLTTRWRNVMLAIASTAALLALTSRPVAALTVHAWCMVYQDVGGAWACRYDSFEECREWARDANQGFCAQNPAFVEPVKPRRARRP